jgi:hypothetical protein
MTIMASSLLTITVVNRPPKSLDAMTRDELRDYAILQQALVTYAMLRYDAIEFRRRGLRADAVRNEEMMNDIYNSLPLEARW